MYREKHRCRHAAVPVKRTVRRRGGEIHYTRLRRAADRGLAARSGSRRRTQSRLGAKSISPPPVARRFRRHARVHVCTYACTKSSRFRLTYSSTVTVDNECDVAGIRKSRSIGIETHSTRRVAHSPLDNRDAVRPFRETGGRAIKKTRRSVAGRRVLSFACSCSTIFWLLKRSSSIVVQTIRNASFAAAGRFRSGRRAAITRRRAPAGTRRLLRAESA